jgi:hypothetical protein
MSCIARGESGPFGTLIPFGTLMLKMLGSFAESERDYRRKPA